MYMSSPPGLTGRATVNESALTRGKLLIIDDDVEWTELLRVFFGGKYDVRVANSAEDGIAIVSTEPPAVIIADLVMPSVDGFGLMQRLNSMLEIPIPVVMTTGWDSADVQKCAAEMGCAAVLAKPVSLPDLEDLVRSLMGPPLPRSGKVD